MILIDRSSNSQPYNIVSAYPSKIFDDEKVSLLDAGLTPNAVLHLRVRKWCVRKPLDCLISNVLHLTDIRVCDLLIADLWKKNNGYVEILTNKLVIACSGA